LLFSSTDQILTSTKKRHPSKASIKTEESNEETNIIDITTSIFTKNFSAVGVFEDSWEGIPNLATPD
jgi:hypothetical protein